MFTGLIEARGRVAALSRRGRTLRLGIEAPFVRELARGESVAVDGVCLTVTGVRGGAFEVDVSETTSATTTLGRASVGRAVNLERALKLGDRLGGHLVTGHVDGLATVVSIRRTAGGADLVLEVPGPLAKHVTPRGSVAVDGVSLTVASVEGARFAVSLIPETLAATGASGYRAGDTANLETDVLAKYQESISAGSGERAGGGDVPSVGGITIERLKELGFTE